MNIACRMLKHSIFDIYKLLAYESLLQLITYICKSACKAEGRKCCGGV